MLDSDISKMKRKIINSLVENEDIITALDAPEITDLYDFIYNRIFPYLHIPSVETEARSYITLKLETTKVMSSNNMFKNIILTLCVVTHQDKMQTVWGGTRNDILAGLLIEEFNWSDLLGFEMELVSDTESLLNETYHVRQIVFKSLAKNYAGCK